MINTVKERRLRAKMGLIYDLMFDFRHSAYMAKHRPVKINVTWRTSWGTKFYVPLTYPLWLLLGKLKDVRWMKRVMQILEVVEAEV